MKLFRKAGHYVTMAPLLLLSLMFMLVPILKLVQDSFKDIETGGFTLENWVTIFTETVYVKSTLNSLEISFVSTVIGMLLSFLVAWAVREVSPGRANRFLGMINMLSNFAGLPLAYAFMTILGNAGFIVLLFRQFGVQLTKIFNLYGIEGLTLLAIYFQIPLGTLMLLPAFEAVRKEWKEAAELMDATGIQFWWNIGIPAMIPSLCDTFALLFANALTAYATFVLLVADNMPILPVKITYIFTGETSGQYNVGSALCVWMILIMVIVIALCNLVKKCTYKGGE